MNKTNPLFDSFLKSIPAVVLLLLLSVYSQAQSGDWISIAPSNTPKWVGHPVLFNNKMYVFSGFDNTSVHTTEKCEVYDPQTDQWAYLADMPTPVTHAGVARDGDKVYIAGGFTGTSANTNLLQIYNLTTNTWSQGPVLPAISGGNALVRVGRKLHSFGGVEQDRQTGALTHFVLDLKQMEKGWTPAAPLPEPRCHIAAVTVAGKIYALGGQVGHDGPNADVNFVHVYDPLTDNWSRLNDMPYGRSHSETGTFVQDGKITLVGGKTGGETIINKVTTYDPAQDTWTEQAPLPLNIMGPTARVIGQELLVANGSHESRINPKTNAWKRAFASTPQYKIGFSPAQLKLSAAVGAAATQTTLLWSLSGSPAFSLAGELPAWLQVQPVDTAIDVAAGTEIMIRADAAHLAVGTYSAMVTARAPGYPDAQMVVELTVRESNPGMLYLYGSMPPALHDMKLADTGDRGLSLFSSAMQEVGFTPSEALDAAITLDSATLAPYQVLVLGSNNRRFTPDERLAVDKWVKAGGGLVAWSDAAFDWDNGGVNSTGGAQSDNDLIQQFGMEFLRDNGVSVFTLNQWAEHHYINRFNKNGGVILEAEGASPIRTSAPATILASLPAVANKRNSLDGTITPADAAISIARVGQGRVLGLFDRNAFWNAGEGTHIGQVDNKVFAQRLMLWASGVDDTQPPMPPAVAAPVADFTVLKNSAPTTLQLAGVFSDSNADTLTLTVTGNTNTAIVTPALQGSTLTLTYTPETLGTAEITLRATDAGGLWVEDKFVVTMSGTEVKPLESVVYRLNAGGIQLSNSLGTFAADAYYNEGHVFSTGNAIAGTDEDAMYQTERTATANNGSFRYAFPVSNGQYKVVLHFAELYWHSEGKRLFDVTMEDALVLDNYDIYKKSGANFTAISEAMSVYVADGSLDILFNALAGDGGMDRPKVSAIEVLAVAQGNQLPLASAGADKIITLPTNSFQIIGNGTDADGIITGYTWSQVSGPNTARFSNAASQVPTISNLVAGTYTFNLVVKDNLNGFSVPDQVTIIVQPGQAVVTGPALYRLNAGGSQLTTSLGTFATDAHYNEGYVFAAAKPIADTEADELYQTERSSSTNNGSFRYDLPVPNGQYLVVLHFAELYWSGVKKRVFDVQAERALVLDNYDIIKKVGANFTATTETLLVQVADSSLNLVFSALAGEGGIDRPKVSAIEVLPASSTNKLPTAQAGADKNITLPDNSLKLTGAATDTDGAISAYAWSQVSGPATATLTGANTAVVSVSDLAAGVYVFRLTATDNEGATAFDETTVRVIPATPGGQQLLSFTLMDAASNQEIKTLVAGETLNLAALPTTKLNIRANTNPAVVGSVKWALTGGWQHYATDNGSPYALFGDNNGVYYSWKPNTGSYTLTATPYGSSDGGGTVGTPLTINFSVVNQPVFNPVVYRLNAGGAQVTNSLGTFAADANYSGGYVYTTSKAIAGTDDDAMYQTERSSSTNNGSFSYALPVSNGQYQVVLHFAELYWNSAGRRVFDLKAEGVLVRDNYDIISKAGASFTAITDTLLVDVGDGRLDLLFSALASEGGVDRPKVSAIEVLTESGANLLPTAHAGADKTITLPTNSLLVAGAGTDPDGTINAYAWSQVSGPAAASLSGDNTASLTAGNLVAGVYVFRLTVTDNRGATAFDEVQTTVNAAAPTVQTLVSFTLIDATNSQEIRTLVDGDTLFLAALPTQNLNIRANTNPSLVGSVKMALSGTQSKNVTESGAPYALFGDNNGKYYSWVPAAGSYTLTGTPYTWGGGSGTAGIPLTIRFQVVNQAAARKDLSGRQQTSLPPVLVAYPNPVKDGRFQVALPWSAAGEIAYELTTITGVRLAKGTRKLAQPESVLHFDFSRQMQTSGMYYLRLEGGSLKHQLRVVRQ